MSRWGLGCCGTASALGDWLSLWSFQFVSSSNPLELARPFRGGLWGRGRSLVTESLRRRLPGVFLI
jgi:hypothetical protein